MSKLTDTQLVLLSTAAQRDDGAVVAPDRMNKTVKAKAASSLIGRKLMRTVRAKPGMPIWSEDEDGKRISLIITRAGREAIGVVDETAEVQTPVAAQKFGAKRAASDNELDRPVCASRTSPQPASVDAIQNLPSPDRPRGGSRQALLVDMLSKPEGATIDALVQTLGWLPHSTRAALTGLRKRGFAITRVTRDNQPSVYSIPVAPAAVKTNKRGARP